MKVSVFGLGYVGAVTAACLAEIGHHVIGVDIHTPKIDAIQQGQAPVDEPGLDDLLERHQREGRLEVMTDGAEAVQSTECSLIAVGTPTREETGVDLSALERCIESIATALTHKDESREHAIFVRSTVPPGTTQRLLGMAADLSGRKLGETLHGGMNPEFLRESSAIDDFFDPTVVVLGADHERSHDILRSLYEGVEAKYVEVPTPVAEIIKYTNNAFHALKIAFANEVGRLAASYDIDGTEVMDVLCMDDNLNISAKYLRPGFAYGGSCLPKDLRALNHFADQQDVHNPVLDAVPASNDEHIRFAGRKIMARDPERVGILGISFKSGTDDVRESPALHLARFLSDRGVEVRMYDAGIGVKDLLGSNRRYIEAIVPEWKELVVSSADELVAFADVVVATNDDASYQNVDVDGETALIELHAMDEWALPNAG
jgi:GDP-mannose 6-dehydrogenase